MAAALSGCFTITPKALSTTEVAPLVRTVNAQRGTTFPARMLLTGVGAGFELPGGFLGLSYGEMKGTLTSDDRSGTPQTISASVKDLTLLGGYPVRAFSDNLGLVVGGEWTLRTTNVEGTEGTSFVLRPRVSLVAAIGGRFVLSPYVTYDLPVIDNETLFEAGGEPIRAGFAGFNGGIGLTYTFGCDCF